MPINKASRLAKLEDKIKTLESEHDRIMKRAATIEDKLIPVARSKLLEAMHTLPDAIERFDWQRQFDQAMRDLHSFIALPESQDISCEKVQNAFGKNINKIALLKCPRLLLVPPRDNAGVLRVVRNRYLSDYLSFYREGIEQLDCVRPVVIEGWHSEDEAYPNSEFAFSDRLTSFLERLRCAGLEEVGLDEYAYWKAINSLPFSYGAPPTHITLDPNRLGYEAMAFDSPKFAWPNYHGLHSASPNPYNGGIAHTINFRACLRGGTVRVTSKKDNVKDAEVVDKKK